MQDATSNHARPSRLACKIWLGGVLLCAVVLLAGLAASAPARAAAPRLDDTPTPTATPTETPTVTPTATVECTFEPDSYEPDDTQSQAGDLAVNAPPQGHTFHVASDVDWFRLTGITAGRSYGVTTSQLTGGADTYIILYDRNYNIVRTNDDIDTDRCATEPQACASSIRWIPTYTGPYYLFVITLRFPAARTPACIPPGYDVRLRSFAYTLPLIIKSPLRQPTPTPTATATATVTPTITPTPTATQPPALPTEIPLAQGRTPNGIAVNPETHRVYVTSRDNGRLLMLDGLANTAIGSAKVMNQPWGVAVNRYTNKVYEANFSSGNLWVIDGASLVTLEILGVGSQPTLVEINENTNTVLVVTYGNEKLVVIDGDTDQIVKSVGTGADGSWGLAVNPDLNRAYVSGRDSHTITTLDGNTGWQPIASQTISTDGPSGACSPYELAYNPANHKLYVACAYNGVDTALVYDAGANGLVLRARVAIGAGGADGGGGVVVNPTTGSAFFTNSLANTVSVISGDTDAVIATAPVGSNPFGIGVDAATGRVFVGNRDGNSVTVFLDPAAP